MLVIPIRLAGLLVTGLFGGRCQTALPRFSAAHRFCGHRVSSSSEPLDLKPSTVAPSARADGLRQEYSTQCTACKVTCQSIRVGLVAPRLHIPPQSAACSRYVVGVIRCITRVPLLSELQGIHTGTYTDRFNEAT